MRGKGVTGKGPNITGMSAGKSRAKELNSNSEKRGIGGGTKTTGSKGTGDTWRKGKR
jgi:hypothetical protein